MRINKPAVRRFRRVFLNVSPFAPDGTPLDVWQFIDTITAAVTMGFNVDCISPYIHIYHVSGGVALKTYYNKRFTVHHYTAAKLDRLEGALWFAATMH